MKSGPAYQSRIFTDSLETQYWPIHAQVLSHNDEDDNLPFSLREVDLIDKTETSRTRAITFLHNQECNRALNPDIALIEEAIKNGGSMGKVFRNDFGYAVRRSVVDVFQIDLPGRLHDVFKVHDDEARAKVSEFHARKEQDHIFYGTLIEIISPDYRPTSMPIESIHNGLFNPFLASWVLSGATVDQLWEYLDQNAHVSVWGVESLAEIYEYAMEMSQGSKLSLRSRIEDYVHKRWMFAGR